MRTRRVATAVAAMAMGGGLVAMVPPAATASGGGDEGVERGGACSGGGRWELKAKHDDGRVEWEFEVDTSRNGQVWNVRVRDNGVRVFAGRRTTRGPSGSFTVERKTADRAGADRFVAVATRGDRVCRGVVTLR